MVKLYGYAVSNGGYGIGTQKEIKDICIGQETEVVNQELANYSDAEWRVCCGCALDDGMYIIKEGILLASISGIEIISNLKICA